MMIYRCRGQAVERPSRVFRRRYCSRDVHPAPSVNFVLSTRSAFIDRHDAMKWDSTKLSSKKTALSGGDFRRHSASSWGIVLGNRTR